MPNDAAPGPVLVCWDGSEGASSVIEHVARIFGDGHPAVVLFAHVLPEKSRGVLGGLSGPDAPIMGAADAEDLLEQGVRLAAEAGLQPTARRVEATERTADVIAAVATEHDAVLIAMGQNRRSALGTLVLGSVARQVLDSDHRPVLLVGPGSPGVYPGSHERRAVRDLPG